MFRIRYPKPNVLSVSQQISFDDTKQFEDINIEDVIDDIQIDNIEDVIDDIQIDN